ncbi:DUF4439 domain-containing protein [Serinicoccus kebangsaanensis]|uniref:DUF4439 domain-containing protein n=1 Tax=Serinicoccus kebangsaanensis TaxID=2602069 RepID=UPI00192DE35E|nr:DUF4439 domain-containing protein [Serinicoccus kebangsaanensis]
MPSGPPSRRALVRAGLWVTVAGALTGCSGDRLRTPWSPDPGEEERSGPQPPDLALIRSARERLRTYSGALEQVRPTDHQESLVRSLGDLWSVQAERLDALLVALGSPATQTSDPTSGTAGPDAASSTTGAALDALEVGRLLRGDREAVVADLAGSTATNRAVLMSLAAQHLLSADRLGAGSTWPALSGPTGTAAVPVLSATRPAVFALEVVAARSGGEERESYESVLAPLRGVTRSLTTLAGDAAPVPPLGYDLPEPLASREDRRALARSVVLDIAPAVLRVVDRAGAAPEQVDSYLRLTVEATSWSLELGADEAPFPGMTLP